MKNLKRKIPLQVLEILEPYVSIESTSFTLVDPGDFLLKFIDSEADSDFYFTIETYKNNNGLELSIDWKPCNKQTIANYRLWIKAQDLNAHFTNWIKILEGYKKVKTIYDRPILEEFTNEYFTDFKILEEDADIKPLKVKQILLLDSHLNQLYKQISRYKNEENEDKIEDIKSNIEELRSNLTTRSKLWVLRKLSMVWAKITIQGPLLLKDLLSETKRTIIKEGVRYIIDQGVEIIT